MERPGPIPEPNPCPPQPGLRQSEISVGVIASASPPAALSFREALVGIAARVRKANQEHELGSRTINLVLRDDADDPARNADAARELVEQQNAFGIIEMSDRSGSSAQYLNQMGVPVTGWHIGVPAWGRYPNMFTFRQAPSAEPDRSYTTREADLLRALGATRVALLASATPSSRALVDRIEKSIHIAGGLDVVAKETVDETTPDFTAVVQRLEAAGADTALTALNLAQNSLLGAALANAGVHLKALVIPAGYDPRVLNIPTLDGAVVGIEFRPLEIASPSSVEFAKWLTSDQIRGQMSYTGWLSADMFLQGLKDAGLNCPTRKAFVNNLRMEHAYTASGAFDPVDLAADFGQEFPCLYYVRIANKQFVPQFYGQPFCGQRITLP